MTEKKPIGLVMIGILAIIFGGLCLLVTLPLVLSFLSRSLKLGLTFTSLVYIAYPLSLIIAGIFLLKERRWARMLFLVLLALLVVFSLIFVNMMYALYRSGTNDSVGFPFNLAPLLFFGLPAIIGIYYLTRPAIKERFKK